MEERILLMLPHLNEIQKRLFLASEALAYGRGGIAEAMRISGVSRNTIKRGINELKSGVKYDGKVRKSGGGRYLVEKKYTAIEEEIRKLIDGSTYGSPERVLSYTVVSLRKIERDLKSRGINVSYETVGRILGFYGVQQASKSKNAASWRTASGQERTV